MQTLWRYTKAQLHWSWLMPPLWLACMWGWTFYRHWPPGSRGVSDLYAIFEYFLPLAAAVYLAGVPAFDRDEGAAETHLGYAQLPGLRLALLALPRLGAWLLAAAAGLLVAQVWYLPGESWHLVKATAAPALALGGAALAGAALLRSQAGGLFAALLWWAFDALVKGAYNKQFFLFRASIRTGLFTPDVQSRNIALVGAAALLAAIWLAHRRSWWIK